MSGHTPGSWKVDIEEGDEWWFGGGGSHKQSQAVIRSYGDGACDFIAVTFANKEADARLMAAAPDLLAALKRMLDLGCDCDGCSAGRAAIAKAEGTS